MRNIFTFTREFAFHLLFICLLGVLSLHPLEQCLSLILPARLDFCSKSAVRSILSGTIASPPLKCLCLLVLSRLVIFSSSCSSSPGAVRFYFLRQVNLFALLATLHVALTFTSPSPFSLAFLSPCLAFVLYFMRLTVDATLE